MTDYEITVVDHQEADPKFRRRMAKATGLIRVGVPLRIAARWEKARKQLGYAGLRRALKGRRN